MPCKIFCSDIKHQDPASGCYGNSGILILGTAERESCHHEMGISWLLKDDLKNARAHFEKSVDIRRRQERHRNNGYAFHVLGQVHWEIGEYDEANACFTEARDFLASRTEHSAKLSLATLYLVCPNGHIADPDSGLHLAEQALMKEDGRSWQVLGLAQLRIQQWHNAIVSLERSIALRSGGDASDYFMMSIAHANAGNLDAAHDCFQRGQNAKRGPIQLDTFVSPGLLDELQRHAKQLLE